MQIVPLIDPGALRQDGSKPLTADWNAGAYDIKAATFSTGSYTFTIDETASLTDYMQDLVDDTLPELGGDLDVGSYSIFGDPVTIKQTAGAIQYLEIDLDTSPNWVKLNAVGTDAHLVLGAVSEILIRPNADTSDYFILSTVSDVPTIGTIGGCDLKITADSGKVTFDDDRITVGDGTAAAPSITFTNHLDAGLFYIDPSGPQGDTVGIAADGSSLFEVSSLRILCRTALNLLTNALTVNAIEVIGADGKVNKAAVEDYANWDAAYTHIAESGASHSYIDQSVVVAGTPQFASLGVGAAASAIRAVNIDKTLADTKISYTGLSQRVVCSNYTIPAMGSWFGLNFSAVYAPVADTVASWGPSGTMAGATGNVLITIPDAWTKDVRIANAYGFNAMLQITEEGSPSGTITLDNAYIYRAPVASVSGQGAITNLYAFYDAGQTQGTTLNYGYYGLSAENYMAGNLKLGGNIEIDGALNHDGSNVGFYGTTPVTQNQLATGAGKTVDEVITELQRLGLVRQAA